MEATEVRLKKGEPIERALRRLKKKLDKEGTLKELRNRRHFGISSRDYCSYGGSYQGFEACGIPTLCSFEYVA